MSLIDHNIHIHRIRYVNPIEAYPAPIAFFCRTRGEKGERERERFPCGPRSPLAPRIFPPRRTAAFPTKNYVRILFYLPLEKSVMTFPFTSSRMLTYVVPPTVGLGSTRACDKPLGTSERDLPGTGAWSRQDRIPTDKYFQGIWSGGSDAATIELES